MNNEHIIQNKIIYGEKINSNYNFTFLDIFKEYIDIEKYYDLLQYLNYKNIINYIYIKWYKLNKNINKNNTICKVNNCDNILLDKILKEFINEEYAIAIFVINCFIHYTS